MIKVNQTRPLRMAAMDVYISLSTASKIPAEQGTTLMPEWFQGVNLILSLILSINTKPVAKVCFLQRLFLLPPFCFPFPLCLPFLIFVSGASLPDGFGADRRCFTSSIPFLKRPSVALRTRSSGLVLWGLIFLSRFLKIPSSFSCIENSNFMPCLHTK